MLDFFFGYSLGVIDDINHDYLKDFDFSNSSTRNMFYVSLGVRFIIGDNRSYMPNPDEVLITGKNVKPKISIDKEFVEKLTLKQERKITVTIDNYYDLVYETSNFRLRVIDSYGNDVVSEAFSKANSAYPVHILSDQSFRSFEEYRIFIEVSYEDGNKKESDHLVFKTGIILSTNNEYKRIATSTIQYNDDQSLTNASMEIIDQIMTFFADYTFEEKAFSLDIGVEPLEEERDVVPGPKTQSRVNSIQNYLYDNYSVDLIAEETFIFQDLYVDDGVPNVIVFDILF